MYLFVQLQNCIIAPLQSDSDYRAISYAYDTACSNGAECMAALSAFNANTTCINAIENDNTEISCTGTCLTIANTVFSVCPNVSRV